MKTMYLYVLCISTLIFSSCSLSKNIARFDDPETDQTTEKYKNCYVQLNDGSIKYYSNLKLVTGLFITPYLLADDHTVIYAKDILAYQNDDRFAVSKKLIKSKFNGKVSTETLPGFVSRVVEGKLNVYSRKIYNGQYTTDEYFLQSGNDGEILSFTPSLLNELVKDNPKVVSFFNSKNKKLENQNKILMAAVMYNNSEYLSKN